MLRVEHKPHFYPLGKNTVPTSSKIFNQVLGYVLASSKCFRISGKKKDYRQIFGKDKGFMAELDLR